MQSADNNSNVVAGQPAAVDSVILVDEQDNETGTAEKISAHLKGGKLHRAFSVFIFDRQGRWLLQKRAAGKYHFPGLWTNTCCSHPQPGETVDYAAHRRLREEMGFDCELRELFCFTYRATHENGLAEWEYDHVLVGTYQGKVLPDPDEVAAWEWCEAGSLSQDVGMNPRKYTPWFKLAMDKVSKTTDQSLE